MIFGLSGVGMLERVYFGPFLGLEVPLKLAALLFLVEVCYVFVAGVWEAVGCIGLTMVMLISIVLSILLIPLSLVLLFRRRLMSVADVLKGIRNKGFTQSRWDALLGFWDSVCRHGPCGPISSFIFGMVGFFPISMASISGCLIPLGC